MKPDPYTKFVLTVIAVALLYLCVAHTIQPAVVQAQSLRCSVPIVSPKDREIYQAVPVVVYQWKYLGDHTFDFEPKDWGPTVPAGK
jgi:hypothetical protein